MNIYENDLLFFVFHLNIWLNLAEPKTEKNHDASLAMASVKICPVGG